MLSPTASICPVHVSGFIEGCLLAGGARRHVGMEEVKDTRSCPVPQLGAINGSGPYFSVLCRVLEHGVGTLLPGAPCQRDNSQEKTWGGWQEDTQRRWTQLPLSALT